MYPASVVCDEMWETQLPQECKSHNQQECRGLEFTDIAFALRKIEAELDRPYQEWLAAMDTVSF